MKVKPFRCPACKGTINGVTRIDGEDVVPKPGDASICLCCGTFLYFVQSDKCLVLDDDDFKRMPTEYQTLLKRYQSRVRGSVLM